MPHVLIADDHPENLYFLEVLLKGNGFTVESAEHGVKALELAHANPPDLIISDILMPVMDGYALCSKLKADTVLRDVPFIFYTATFTTAKDEALALSLGADRFVIKPQEPDALMAIIRQLLETPRSSGLPATSEEIVTEYSEALFRKLEKKMADLEQLNADLQKKNLELQRAREDAECANQAKLRFLYTMSHELRTPLNAVMGALQLSELDHAYNAEMIEGAKQAVGSMVTIIDNILEASRIESAELSFVQAPLNLELLLATLGRMFDVAARNKGLELRMTIAEDLPRQLLADAQHLKQIVVHLLNNAIKFTEKGMVELRLNKTSAAVSGRPLLRIDVQDTGVGIAPDKQRLIFDLFTQADDSNTRTFGGVGLGLALTKRLVELLGGTISVTSGVGSGTTFTVMLPMAV